MDKVIERIAVLIEHLRLESLGQQARCFYCNGNHKTVYCMSPKRNAFLLSLGQLNEIWEADDLFFHEEEYAWKRKNYLPVNERQLTYEEFCDYFGADL